jgi:hypothetical protein
MYWVFADARSNKRFAVDRDERPSSPARPPSHSIRVFSMASAAWKSPASRRWHWAAGIAVAAAVVTMGGQGGAGHSVGHFPSYYPDEIRIDTVDPKAAAARLADHTLHAYVGSAPKLDQTAPSHIKSVKSLGFLLVLSFDAASKRFASAEARCAAARGILAALAEEKAGGLIFHPYPVTPYHADYLHHIDRVEAAKSAIGAASPSLVPQGIDAKGRLAETVVRARFGSVANGADILLEAMPVGDLVSAASSRLWPGPPWIKDGWFHAYRLLEPGVDAEQRPAVDEAYQRLVRGDLRGGGLAEHADLERRLVAGLTAGCQRLVVGYVPREEHFAEAYPPGVENIGFDAIAGLNSPLFIRTAKLKEYPWNGKLHLAVREPPHAAWNPVAGFTDSLGRLMWSAVGDPAMIPFPVNAAWMPNRIQSELTKVEGVSGGIKVPADALRPEPGSGVLQRVGDRTFASLKVTYEVIASPFDDGTEQSVADALYPFSFIYRWGADPHGAGGVAGAREPSLEPVLAAVAERLAGVKVVRVDRTKHTIAEGLEIVVKTPVVEVYLNAAPGDETQVAALAPPWSTVPWHLLALMEEAVDRGYAAFSEAESKRLGVPWLDLVRDPALQGKLRDLIVQFEREGHRPAALRDLVTADEARQRWRTLRAYADKNGHFLVANGPYRLKSWTPGSVALEAVREMTYPLGLGTYDRFVYPPRAVIKETTQAEGSIVVRASAEMTLKGGRGVVHTKEPLKRTTARGTNPLLVVSRYLLIDPAGKVLKLDKMHWREDGDFIIDLPQQLPPGDYTVILGVFLDGNAIEPSTRTLRIRRLGASGGPG